MSVIGYLRGVSVPPTEEKSFYDDALPLRLYAKYKGRGFYMIQCCRTPFRQETKQSP